MLVGYARVSTVDQDPEAQVLALEQRGCERIFRDRASGRLASRPELNACLDFLRPGDSLVVWRFDRLGRSTRHLLGLAARLRERGCHLVSLTEAIDTSTPGGRLVFKLFASLAAFEAELASERTKLAARAAKAQGRHWGRGSIFFDPEVVSRTKALLRDASLQRQAIAKSLGVTPTTLYKWFPRGDPDAFPGNGTLPAQVSR